MPVAPTLVLLAAGLGSRFGGPKQLVSVGLDDEPMFVLTARDALAAGFDRLIIVTRTSLADDVTRLVERHLPGAPAELVLQDDNAPPRERPWGTAHAVAVCADRLDGPMALANADDLYGERAIAQAAAETARLADDEAVVIAYPVGATLSPLGPVNRAECQTSETALVGLAERYDLVRDGDRVVDRDGHVLESDAPVSMNLIGLGVGVVRRLGKDFEAFAAAHVDDDVEYVLPDTLCRYIDAGEVTARCVPTTSEWLGMTTRDDLELVRARLRRGDWR